MSTPNFYADAQALLFNEATEHGCSYCEECSMLSCHTEKSEAGGAIAYHKRCECLAVIPEECPWVEANLDAKIKELEEYYEASQA